MVERPSDKYALIHDLVTSAGKEFSVRYLCEVAGVSRSDYYLSKGRKAGWRVVRMDLERKRISMNLKKIRRLMKKYGLTTQIRRRNPYRHIAKATLEHTTVPNVLNRRFSQETPFRAFGTDITYLYDSAGRRWYLSILLDIASGAWPTA